MRVPLRRALLAIGAATLLAPAGWDLHGVHAQQNPPATGGQTPAPAPAGQPQSSDQPTQQQTPQTPIFRTGVNYVRVDVTVTDGSGQPVTDLKMEDFEVTESGKPQTIDTFKLIALDGGLTLTGENRPQSIRNDAMEEQEAARDDVRLFAIFLDDYHVKRDSSRRATEQLLRALETQFGPSDMIGMMYPLDPIGSIKMTRNHDVIRRAVSGFQGRKYDYTPRNAIEERYVNRVDAEQIERIRNQTSFAAIRSLIMKMGGLKEGRKSLILVSEGYSNSLPPQMMAYYGGMGGGGVSVLNTDPGPGGGLAVPTGYEAFRNVDLNMDLQDIFNLANRNNVSIYAVDPRGLATNEFGVDLPAVDRGTDRQYLSLTMDTLKSLAENTDGRAIVSRNDLTLAMKQVVVDASAYYLLGYNSSLTDSDGKFHEINVKVKRSGLQLRHRKGYWALKPEEAARVAAPAAPRTASVVESAMEKTSVPRSRLVRTWLGNERGDNGTTRVTFVWEPTPRPGQEVRESDRPSRVTLTASNADGQVFRGRVPDSGAPPTSAAGARVSFTAKPGPLQLRLSIEGAGAEVLDSEVREITVPDMTSPQTTFGTPLLFRARTVPEMQRLRTDAAPIPVVGREFSRTDRLLVRAPVYGPAGSPPVVTAALLNRAGQSMAELPVTADAARGVSQVELALANLSPGEFAIQLSATGAAGDATEVVAFRITP